MIKVVFTKNAADDLCYWKKRDIQKYRKIHRLIQNIQETPFYGIGKPSLCNTISLVIGLGALAKSIGLFIEWKMK